MGKSSTIAFIALALATTTLSATNLRNGQNDGVLVEPAPEPETIDVRSKLSDAELKQLESEFMMRPFEEKMTRKQMKEFYEGLNEERQVYETTLLEEIENEAKAVEESLKDSLASMCPDSDKIDDLIHNAFHQKFQDRFPSWRYSTDDITNPENEKYIKDEKLIYEKRVERWVWDPKYDSLDNPRNNRYARPEYYKLNDNDAKHVWDKTAKIWKIPELEDDVSSTISEEEEDELTLEDIEDGPWLWNFLDPIRDPEDEMYKKDVSYEWDEKYQEWKYIPDPYSLTTEGKFKDIIDHGFHITYTKNSDGFIEHPPVEQLKTIEEYTKDYRYNLRQYSYDAFGVFLPQEVKEFLEYLEQVKGTEFAKVTAWQLKKGGKGDPVLNVNSGFIWKKNKAGPTTGDKSVGKTPTVEKI